LHISLAASNLIATKEVDVSETINNIQQIYIIRNKYVHGDPISDYDWADFIENTSSRAKIAPTTDNHWYAIEILRDYAERVALSLLNIHYNSVSGLENKLLNGLSTLHADRKLQREIQKLAKVFLFSERL
jgi:hypothetical protein